MFKKIDENMVILKADSFDSETKSGFKIQSGMNETKKEIGTVFMVGNNVSRIQKGDRVIFKAYNADTVEYDGEQYEFVDQQYILCVI